MKIKLIIGMTGISVLFLLCYTGGKHKEEQNMGSEKQIIDSYVAVWNGADPAALDSILTPGYVRHVTKGSGPAGSPEKLKKVIAALRLDVPDLTIKVRDLLIKENSAVFRWESEGTDSGPGDFPPTNKRFKSDGITWLRFEDGRIAEEWSASDQLDVLLQLGFGIQIPKQ